MSSFEVRTWCFIAAGVLMVLWFVQGICIELQDRRNDGP